MKNLRITVNGRVYDVQVEEMPAGSAPAPAAPAPAAAPVPAPAPAPAPAAAPAPAPVTAANTEGAEKVNAPMPGTIVDLKVAVGDTVKANQVLLILEAMKMENEIMSPCAGTVAAIHVKKGEAVNSGQPMISVKP